MGVYILFRLSHMCLTCGVLFIGTVHWVLSQQTRGQTPRSRGLSRHSASSSARGCARKCTTSTTRRGGRSKDLGNSSGSCVWLTATYGPWTTYAVLLFWIAAVAYSCVHCYGWRFCSKGGVELQVCRDITPCNCTPNCSAQLISNCSHLCGFQICFQIDNRSRMMQW